MISQIKERLLFTKSERFLLRHQAIPFVIRSSKDKSKTDFSTSENEFVPSTKSSQYYDILIDGVYESVVPKEN